MQYGIVIGTVVATQKVKELQGHSLKIIAPCDETQKFVGEQIVAIDPISARPGDFVLWVGKREASLAIPDSPLANLYPVDAAITGLVDQTPG